MNILALIFGLEIIDSALSAPGAGGISHKWQASDYDSAINNNISTMPNLEFGRNLAGKRARRKRARGIDYDQKIDSRDDAVFKSRMFADSVKANEEAVSRTEESYSYQFVSSSSAPLSSASSAGFTQWSSKLVTSDSEIRCTNGTPSNPTTRKSFVVPYYYSIKEIEEGFLKSIQKALLEAVADEILFCGTDNEGRTLNSTRKLQSGAVAVKIFPKDEISTMLKCAGRQQIFEQCYIVSGGLTMTTFQEDNDEREYISSRARHSVDSFFESITTTAESTTIMIHYFGENPPFHYFGENPQSLASIDRSTELESSSHFNKASSTFLFTMVAVGAMMATVLTYFGANELLTPKTVKPTIHSKKLDCNVSVQSMIHDNASVSIATPPNFVKGSSSKFLPDRCEVPLFVEHRVPSDDCDWGLPAISIDSDCSYLEDYLEDVAEETHSSDHSSDGPTSV